MATRRTICSSQWLSFWTYSSYRSDAYVTIQADVSRNGNTLTLTNITWNMTMDGSMRWSGGGKTLTFYFRALEGSSYRQIGSASWYDYTRTGPAYFNGTFPNATINLSSPQTALTTIESFNIECADGPQYFSTDIPYYTAPEGTYIKATNRTKNSLTIEYGVTKRATLNDYGVISYPPMDFYLKKDNDAGPTLDSHMKGEDSSYTFNVTGLQPDTDYTYFTSIGVADLGIGDLWTNASGTFRTRPDTSYIGKIIYPDGTSKYITSGKIISTSSTKNITRIKKI